MAGLPGEAPQQHSWEACDQGLQTPERLRSLRSKPRPFGRFSSALLSLFFTPYKVPEAVLELPQDCVYDLEANKLKSRKEFEEM